MATTNAQHAPLYPAGTKVIVQGTHEGEVCGHGFQHSPNRGEPARVVYLVKLEKGFYSAGDESRMFVSVITADPTNVTELKG